MARSSVHEARRAEPARAAGAHIRPFTKIHAGGQVAVVINQILTGQGLSRMAAARRLKINRPKIFALAGYRLEGFFVERLMHFLTAFDCYVEIVIRPKPRSRGGARILVTAA